MPNIRIPRLNPLLRELLIALSWGVTTSTILVSFVFQGYFVPGFNTANPQSTQSGVFLAYTLVFLVALFSGTLLSEFSIAIRASFVSLAVAAIVEYLVLTLPSILNIPGTDVLAQIGLPPIPDTAITIVFSSIFPGPLFLGLIGAFLGALLGERFLD